MAVGGEVSKDDVVIGESGTAGLARAGKVRATFGGEVSKDDVGGGEAGAAGSAPAGKVRVGATSGSKSDGSAAYVGGSHNKRRKCPLCSFHGIHLARHLASIHPGSADSPAERARLVYKVDEEKCHKQGHNTTLSNPNERLY